MAKRQSLLAPCNLGAEGHGIWCRLPKLWWDQRIFPFNLRLSYWCIISALNIRHTYMYWYIFWHPCQHFMHLGTERIRPLIPYLVFGFASHMHAYAQPDMVETISLLSTNLINLRWHYLYFVGADLRDSQVPFPGLLRNLASNFKSHNNRSGGETRYLPDWLSTRLTWQQDTVRQAFNHQASASLSRLSPKEDNPILQASTDSRP